MDLSWGTTPAALPVLIRRLALAAGVPHRDLYVSPRHALFLDGVLVPAELLVNGASIRRCDAVEVVEYFHIELEAHDVVSAEGAAAESYIECDNRGEFHNAHEFTVLYPDDDRPSFAYCAPFVEAGDVLRRVRQQLAERFPSLGYSLTTDPDLRLIADGREVRPEAMSGLCYRFRLARPPSALRIASRSSVPREVRAAADSDSRRLGVTWCASL